MSTSPALFENVMCPRNVTSALNCSFIAPPVSSRCYSSFSAAGVHCIQGRQLTLSEYVNSVSKITVSP